MKAFELHRGYRLHVELHSYHCISILKMSLKSKFGVQNKYEPFYTGGKIQITNDGRELFCGCGNKIQVLDIQTGQCKQFIGQMQDGVKIMPNTFKVKDEDEEISCFHLTPDNQHLVLATKLLVLRQWKWKEKVLVRTWKAIHVAPISCMDFDVTSTLLATGSADSTIKVWDIEKQYCTHNFRGHQGVISIVKFHPDISKLQMFSAADDYKVRVWNLQTSVCITAVEVHYSVVTDMCFTQDGNTMISGGRDSIIAVWDIPKLKVKKTIPVFENIESVILLPEGKEFPDLSVSTDSHHVITAGSKGTLRVWDINKSRCVYTRSEVLGRATDTESGEQNITQAFYCLSLHTVVVVTFDHNISLLDANDLSLQKHFCGNTDQVLEIAFLGEDDSYLAVATNSEHLKIFELATWSCQILHGHTDLIVGVTVHKNKRLLATCSKDNSVRIWRLNDGKVHCVAVGHGHTHTVGSVTFSCLSTKSLVSGGQDCTIKVWDIPSNLSDEEISHLHSTITEKAHEKDINSVTVAPNDKFIATGSQDKTAKLWNIKDLSLLGVMRGHKRGIWHVEFSPVDQCLATSSGDGTIKIWSLTDFTCVKTFEGHDSSVLKVSFLTRGMQLLSCGSDGLMKLWNIKNGTCASTMDEHEEKIWALAVNKKENMVATGGADSKVILWKDVTEEEEDKKREENEQIILKEQELSNLLHQKKYLKAIGLAITLEQPFRVLNILKDILSHPDGAAELEGTLQKLRMDQIDAVLRFSGEWNTNSKHCHEAQFVLNTVLKSHTQEELMEFPNIKSTLEALLPYTERHFQRMNRLLQQAMFVEYTWQCMRTVTEKSQPESGTKMQETSRFDVSPLVEREICVKQKSSDVVVVEMSEEKDDKEEDEIDEDDREDRMLDEGDDLDNEADMIIPSPESPKQRPRSSISGKKQDQKKTVKPTKQTKTKDSKVKRLKQLPNSKHMKKKMKKQKG